MRYVVLVLSLLAIAVGVLCLGTLKMDGTTKDDYARMNAMALFEAAKSWADKHEEAELTDIDELVPYLDRGEDGLLDPWGQKYQLKTVEDHRGRPKLVFWTTNPKTGKVLGWPKELAEPNR